MIDTSVPQNHKEPKRDGDVHDQVDQWLDQMFGHIAACPKREVDNVSVC